MEVIVSPGQALKQNGHVKATNVAPFFSMSVLRGLCQTIVFLLSTAQTETQSRWESGTVSPCVMSLLQGN